MEDCRCLFKRFEQVCAVADADCFDSGRDLTRASVFCARKSSEEKATCGE